MLGKSLLSLFLIGHFPFINGIVIKNPAQIAIESSFSEINVSQKTNILPQVKVSPPAKITPLFLRSNNDAILEWITNLNMWSSDLLTLSYNQANYRISEAAKAEIMTGLSNYYSKDQAERLFSLYYKKSQDGLYEYLETESLSRIGLIEKNLKIKVQEQSDSYAIEITGQFLDEVNESEVVVNEIFEQYVFSKGDLRINEITRRMR